MAYSYDGYLRFNTEIDNSGFEKGAENLEKSAKSRAAKLAAEYKRQGMNSSDAFKKAWSEIERDSKNGADSVKTSLGSLSNAAALGAKAVAVGWTAATGAVTAVSTYAIAAGSNFEAGMSKVQATSQVSATDMELLTAKAKEMGATTKFSATESAEALNYMAMAGWKTQAMLDGIPGIMNLAAASGENLGSVSDIVTDAMTAFGLQASESGHFADVLAQASSSANTNVSMMGATFKYVAPVAGALKYSIEDTAVAIGLMANAGIKGEQAGTQFRAVLTRLVSPTKDSEAAMKDLGLSIKNSDGSMKDFASILVDLRSGMAKFTDDQKASYAAMLGGQEAMSGLLAIANASEADFQNLTNAINSADGAAEEMAKTVNDNLKGDLTILGSTAEGVGIKMYEKFQEPMRNAAKAATESLGEVLQSLNGGQLDKSVDKIADSAGRLLAKTAELTANGLPKLLDGFTYVIDHGKQVTSIIVGATTAFVGYNTAVKVTKEISSLAATATKVLAAAQVAETAATGLGTKAWVLFNAAIAANPIGLAAVALGSLAAGLVYYNQVQGEATEKSNELINATKDKISAWEESKQAKLEEMQTQVSELETTKEMIDELGRLTDANGKVGDNKARVVYLSEKINEILPDTVKFIDDETLAINGNIESLKRQIELKQANILLEELEIEAAEARKKRVESLNVQMQYEEDIAAQEAEIAKMRIEASRAVSDTTASYLQMQIDAKEKNLQDTKASLSEEKVLFNEYVSVISDSSKLAIAIQQEDYDEVDRIMAQKELRLKSAGDSTRKELLTQINELQGDYDYLTQSIKNGSLKADDELVQQIEKQLDSLKTELDRRTTDLVTAMESNGENVTLGFARGLIAPWALTQVQDNAGKISDIADRAARARAQIHSPSRVAMVTGGFYTEGYALGIINNKDMVINAVSSLSDNIIKAATEKATSYKNLGSIYIKNMSNGIDNQTNLVIKSIEKIVGEQTDAHIESLGKNNEKAKKKYREDATEIMSTYREALRAGADAAKAIVSEKVQAITEEAQKQYDEIICQRDKLEQKLSGYGELFTRDEDGKVQLENLDKQTDALKRYEKALEDLQEKGISDGLLNEILNMGMQDGTDFAEKLLKSDGVFQKYNDAWTEKQETAKAIAEKFYADELETLDQNFTQELDTALASIPEECTNVGVDAIKGVIDGMNSQKADAVQTARDIADAIIKELKRATETASPSKRAAREVGKPLTQGIIKGMNDAYDPQELQSYTDRMMVDIGHSQAKAAQNVSYLNTSSIVNSATYNNGGNLTVMVDKIINDGKGSVKSAMQEFEFYRRQQVTATGGA